MENIISAIRGVVSEESKIEIGMPVLKEVQAKIDSVLEYESS